MESRLQRIFLIRIVIAALIVMAPTSLWAQEDDGSDIREKTILDSVIEPDLDRRVIQEDKIDSENIEIGFYSGVMSFEDFGSNNAFGYRLAYHLSEDWFLEGNYGITEVGLSSAEAIFQIRFMEADRTVEYYNLSLGVNLFPGEIFLGRNYAFNSNFYLILGAGNTKFVSDEYFTYNFGAGFRMFITDWLAFRADFRNHLLTHSVLGEEKSIQNLESNIGLSLFF